MKKIRKTIVLTTLLLSVAVVAQAQIFMTEADLGPRYGAQDPNGIIPLNGTNWDQSNAVEEYAPFGNGILLCSAFGMAYLWKRNKGKKNNQTKL